MNKAAKALIRFMDEDEIMDAMDDALFEDEDAMDDYYDIMFDEDDAPSWQELMQDNYPSDENGKIFDTPSGF